MARLGHYKIGAKKAVAVSNRIVKRSQHPRLTYKEGGVTSTVNSSSMPGRSDSDRIITATRTYFKKGVAVKAIKLVTSISTTATTLFDILSISDSCSDIDVDKFEVEANAEVAANLEAYVDIDVDEVSDIEDSSAFDSDGITPPRTPAPFPMSPPSADSSDEGMDIESEDEGEDEGFISGFLNSVAKPARQGPRSDFEFILPNVSVGSTSSARTTIRRYIGNQIAQPIITGQSTFAPASGSSANPIDLTNDSDEEADNEADSEDGDETDDEGSDGQ
ncbi:hypothetical protein HYPSUDRAFT_208099 [Hypholoma sublateritium FD-334 SS-4]|uniref:Uncharacterized protein n=1 Tax=Hypholoma sublateritium (strain FD-334 SS-4) TaxID=945553 RepID=A0A0D2P3U5_HYPSF|nr:hypothetical protein HYPSUDRAFT_208099 [Hypholoma sublateritium FD-334 SS-4]